MSETAIEKSHPEQVITVGLDLAKNIFHVHGVTEDVQVAFTSGALRSHAAVQIDAQLGECLNVSFQSCGMVGSHLQRKAGFRPLVSNDMNGPKPALQKSETPHETAG